MSYYYLKEDNPFYGSKGNRMPEIIYSKLPLKHKELFSSKKIEEDSSVTNKTSGDAYERLKKDYIGMVNEFLVNKRDTGLDFVERDPFEGIMVPFDDDDDENYEDDYNDDYGDDDDDEGGW